MDHPFLRALDRRRESLGMTRVALAKMSKVSIATIHRILDGESMPRIPVLLDVIKALKVDVAFTSQGEIVVSESCRPYEYKMEVAKAKAAKIVGMAQGTSALEGQGMEDEQYQEMVGKTVHDLMAGSTHRLWR